MEMIYIEKKSQITVIEISFVLLLFIFVIGYFSLDFKSSQNDYVYNIDSFLDALDYSNEYRINIMQEDLTNIAITEDWSNLEILLNNSFNYYEFIILNSSHSKVIFSCNATINKYFTERIVAIEDNDNYNFRRIRLGVCY